MPRSIKKGPFLDNSIHDVLQHLKETNERRVIKTWSRRSTIIPDMVGHTFAVHNGKSLSLCLYPKTWWVIN